LSDGCNPTDITDDGIAHINCTAESAGGENSSMVTIKRDATPPTISSSTIGPANAAGWHNTDLIVNFTCGDYGPSGKDSSAVGDGCGPNPAINSETAGKDIVGIATDMAGNTATDTVTVKLDKTPPTLTGILSTPPNLAGWHNTDVSLSWSCSDALSGAASCPQPQQRTITTEGADQEITGVAEDRAGNTTETTGIINLDKTPPTIVGNASPSANAAGWNNTDVTVSFTCSDALSGIDTCTQPTALSNQGAGQSKIGTAIDKAGNNASNTVSDINIDKTPPVVTIIIPGGEAEFLLNQVVPAEWEAIDELSGLDSSTGTVSTGQTIDTSNAGEKSFEVNAIDLAGNETAVSRTYTVLTPAEAIVDLQDDIDALETNAFIKRYLSGRLLTALFFLNRDRFQWMACWQLDWFISIVNRQTPRYIDTQNAASLIAQAEAITASLNCR
jgi:hypothetical protein